MLTKQDVARALGKPAGWHDKRRGYIGGSDAPTIMSGLDDALYDLWLEKRGQKAPADLSDVLPVQIGTWTEPLGVFWFEKKTGLTVSREGEHTISEEHPFMACSLDGFVEAENANYQGKHCSGREPIDTILERYNPQFHHEMIVTGTVKTYLSVFMGTGWQYEVIPLDPFYAAALIEREAAFWDCVTSGKPPCAAPHIAAPMPEKLRELDMSKSNSWVANSTTWRETREAAKQHEAASKELKGALERDVGRAYGAGIQITRARNGALTIREFAQ